MPVLHVKLLKLTILNLIFLNILAQDLPKVTSITSAEIQTQSVLLASDINRDWWLKAGIYTTAIVAAGMLFYNRDVMRAYWQGDKKLISDPGFTDLERQKLRELLAQTELIKRQAASNSFMSQVKHGTLGAAGMAVVGVVAEPILTPAANTILKPAVKFMSGRHLDYYLYKTSLYEQILSLKDFVQYTGEYQLDNGVILDLKPEINAKLIKLRVAMMIVLGYLEYVQNDIAAGIEAAQASDVQLQLIALRGVTVSVQATCNNILEAVQNSLGNLKSQTDQDSLGNQIYKLHVALDRQLKEFKSRI